MEYGSKEYKDTTVKENAWNFISEEVKLSKEVKRVTGTETPPPTSEWPYFQSMSFIKDTVWHRK